MTALKITSLGFLASLVACGPLSFDPDSDAGGAGGETSGGVEAGEGGLSGGASPAVSTGGATSGGGVVLAGAGGVGAGGRTDPRTTPPAGSCEERSLDVAWPVISGCLEPPDVDSVLNSNSPRCPFPEQINVPNYGAFVACCPPEAPYACPNGTPHTCYATKAEAEASCAGACVICVEHSAGGAPSD